MSRHYRFDLTTRSRLLSLYLTAALLKERVWPSSMGIWLNLSLIKAFVGIVIFM